MAKYQHAIQQRLRRAELERAQALVKAEEEHKRMQVERQKKRMARALGLVAVVSVLAFAAVAAWYVQDQGDRELEKARLTAEQIEHAAQETTRQESLERDVAAALDQEALLQKGLMDWLKDPKKVHVLLSKMEDWHNNLVQRAEILKRAGKLWDNGQGKLAANPHQRLHESQDRLERDRQNLFFAQELDAIRQRAAVWFEGEKPNPAVVLAECYSVFSKRNLDLKNEKVDQLAEQIAASPLHFILVAALDHWANETEDSHLQARLLAVASQASSDPWGVLVRDTKGWQDLPKLEELTDQLNPEQESPELVMLLAKRLRRAGGQGAPVVRQATVHHPASFWLYFELAKYQKDPVAKTGCYQAALAARPQSPAALSNLGTSLYQQKDLAGAAACYKKVNKDHPQFAPAHIGLGLVLRDQKELSQAVACFQKALALEPKNGFARNSLSLTLLDQKKLDEAIAGLHQAVQDEPD